MPIYALDDLVPDVDPDAFVHPDAVLIGAVRIASGASVWPCAVLRADLGEIQIGAGTSVQDGAVLHTDPKRPTVVGDGCILGHLTHLEGCVIGNSALVGSGSVVLADARVAPGAIVAAGALVPEGMDVPAGNMAVGVPARLRPAPFGASEIAVGAGIYARNVERYRSGLRRID